MYNVFLYEVILAELKQELNDKNVFLYTFEFNREAMAVPPRDVAHLTPLHDLPKAKEYDEGF